MIWCNVVASAVREIHTCSMFACSSIACTGNQLFVKDIYMLLSMERMRLTECVYICLHEAILAFPMYVCVPIVHC